MLELERADPRSSVTFINLAQTGATIDVGIRGPYGGTQTEALTVQTPRSQRDALESIIGGPKQGGLQGVDGVRSAEKIYLSIGGNDAGFANIIKASFVAWEEAFNSTDLAQIEHAFEDGNWGALRSDGMMAASAPVAKRILISNSRPIRATLQNVHDVALLQVQMPGQGRSTLPFSFDTGSRAMAVSVFDSGASVLASTVGWSDFRPARFGSVRIDNGGGPVHMSNQQTGPVTVFLALHDTRNTDFDIVSGLGDLRGSVAAAAPLRGANFGPLTTR